MTSPNASSPAPGGGGARVFEGGEGAFASTSKSGGSDNQPPRTQSSLWSLLETDLGWFGLARTPKSAEKIIEDSGLPTDHRALIARVVKRTKLWRRERADVARELVAHFADGLAASAVAEDLINSFGDEKQAAKLIRRAKKRNRGIVWQVWKRGWQAAGCFVTIVLAAYLYLGMRVWTAAPSIRYDYVAELNARALAMHDEDRGWPVVREAIILLGDEPLLTDAANLNRVPLHEVRPGDSNWFPVVSYLESSQLSLDLLREATQRPFLGRRLVIDDDREFMVAVSNWPANEPLPAQCDNTDLTNVMLPHLGAIRGCGWLLLSDSLLAASLGQGGRVVDDLRAALWLAEHLGDDGFLISSMVGVSLMIEALKFVSAISEQFPEALSDEQWVAIAHTIAVANGGGRIVLPLGSERIMFADILQRTFTDDGAGNGVATREGIRLFGKAFRKLIKETAPHASEVPEVFAVPIASALVADRRLQAEVFDRIVSQAEAMASHPQWEQPTAEEIEQRLDGRLDEPAMRIRFAPVNFAMVGFRRLYRVGERATQQRDAALVIIALQLYYWREGAYPATLSELVPGLLPAVPPDRHTGKPLNYVLKDGKPVLYSVGTDLDDDGGRVSRDNISASVWMHPADLARTSVQERKAIPDGDWILYPPSMTR